MNPILTFVSATLAYFYSLVNKKEKENQIYEGLERVRDLIERIGLNHDMEDILKEIQMEMSETS